MKPGEKAPYRPPLIKYPSDGSQSAAASSVRSSLPPKSDLRPPASDTPPLSSPSSLPATHPPSHSTLLAPPSRERNSDDKSSTCDTLSSRFSSPLAAALPLPSDTEHSRVSQPHEPLLMGNSASDSPDSRRRRRQFDESTDSDIGTHEPIADTAAVHVSQRLEAVPTRPPTSQAAPTQLDTDESTGVQHVSLSSEPSEDSHSPEGY